MNSLDPKNIFKGSLIGVVSLGTFKISSQERLARIYYDKETGKKVLRNVEVKGNLSPLAKNIKKTDEEIFFAVANGLFQIFTPKITDDESLQRILINPLLSSFSTLLYKESKGKDTAPGTALKYYFSAVTAAALVELPLNNLFNKFQ